MWFVTIFSSLVMCVPASISLQIKPCHGVWLEMRSVRCNWFLEQHPVQDEQKCVPLSGCARPQVCVRAHKQLKTQAGTLSCTRNWDLLLPFKHLLTDSGGGRRALELEAWEQLGGPLPGTCPGTGVWVWPRAEIRVKGVAGPIMGPGAWFGPGQGWEPCGAWVRRRPRRNNWDPIEGKLGEIERESKERKGPRNKKKQVQKEIQVKSS